MLSNHSTQQTEVKLLKDEKWKVIQQNTFTRWVNKQLKHSTNSPQLENLVILFGLLCDFLGVQTSFRDQLGGDPKGLRGDPEGQHLR